MLQLGSTYVMYYAADFGTSGEECISAAVATNPEGPFVDNSDFPIVCQLNLGGSIDPSPFIDPTAGIFLDWKSEGAGGQPPTIWAQQLNGTGTQVVGTSPTAELQPSQSWEEGVVERPHMFWLDGKRYLFYSGGGWNTTGYAIGLAECPGPMSPCTRIFDHPLFATLGEIEGPGGGYAFWSSASSAEIAFAAWLPNEIGYPHSRVLFVRPLRIVEGVPVVCPPPGSNCT